MRYLVFLLTIFVSISTQGQTHQVQSSELNDLTGEILIIEGGNEVNCDDGFDTSINYDQLWISYTGDEDVEFTILVNESISISGGGGGEKHYYETYDNTYDFLNDDHVSQYICWDSQNNCYIVDLYSFVYAELYDNLVYWGEADPNWFYISGTFCFLVSVQASGYNDLSGEYTVYGSRDPITSHGPEPPDISDPICSDLTAFITIEFPCSNNSSGVYSPYSVQDLSPDEGEKYMPDVYAFERRDEDYYVSVYASNYSAPTGIDWGESSRTILIPARECSISISRFLDNEPQSEYYIVGDVDGERVEYGEKESYAVVDFNQWLEPYGNIWGYKYEDYSWYFEQHISIDGQLVDAYYDYPLSYVIDLLPYGDAFGGERHIEVIATEKYNSLSVDTVLTYHPIETNLSYNSLIIDVNSGKGGFNLFINGEEVELSNEGDDLPAHIYALPRLDYDYSVTVQVGNNLYIDDNGNLSVVYTGLSQETTILVPAKQIFDFEIDGVYYKVTNDNENEVEVAHGEEAYQGVVFLPSTVTYDGITYNVIGIRDGTFTDATLQSLILPVTIGAIGDGAFSGCHIGSLVITGNGAWTAGAIDCNVDGLYVMSGVTGIAGLQVNPATVYSYSTLPPTCSDESFTGYDGALHVPASALAAYFTAPYWNYFINITSDAVEPTEVTLNNDSVSVLVGNQLTLTATPAPANATPYECIWTSSDDNIATVEDGMITAVHVGECDIKAYLLDKMAVCHVTVTEIAPTEITISPEFAKLEIGSQVTLTATVMPEDATDKTVIWETTNSDVATVDSDGNVTAVGQGECFITATCRDNQATCHIIVVDHFVFITLDEHSVRMMPNHMAILTPSVMPEGTDLVVTSSNPAVAAARMANGKIQVVGITEGRTVIKVNSTDGYAEVDSCLVRVYTLRGDVNSDGFVNIGDVTALIGYVLSGNANGVNLENADANNDGGINIGDVTRLIGAILSGEELDPKEEPIEGAETFTVNGVTFTMMPVEGGTFTMGATPEQGTSDPWNDERPTHEVTLSAFMIGQTEVTQALWQAVMGSNPSEFSDNPNRPVEMVSWDDCQAFIAQLNQLTGRNFRLPTEAEWEYAARGGKQSQGYKYAGGDDVNEVAWWDTNAGDGVGPDSPNYGTHQVCTKKANELGLFDMSGNVWEWCQDWYGSYSSDAQTNPAGPATGSNRVYRGGSWYNYARNCRVSSRYHWTMNGTNYIGLRLAL